MRGNRLMIRLALGVIAVVGVLFPVATVATASTTSVPVLMYHRIAEHPPSGTNLPGLYVTPEAFDAQLGALWARGWHSITAAALGEAIRTGRAVPGRTFVISLDDGRADGYTTAWPIMRKYGFVGTFYVVPGHIGHDSFMTWDMATALAAAGNEIGNHTEDHVSLPSYHGVALAAEIDGAATAIETRLASRGVTTTVSTFAYPYGRWSAEAMRLLASRGYTFALTTALPSGSSLSSGPLRYPRVRVSRGEDLQTFLVDLEDATRFALLGAPPATSASGSPTAPSTTSRPTGSTASPEPAATSTVVVSDTSSPSAAARIDQATDTAAPIVGANSRAVSASADGLLAIGGLGLLLLLLTGVTALRWRRR